MDGVDQLLALGNLAQPPGNIKKSRRKAADVTKEKIQQTLETFYANTKGRVEYTGAYREACEAIGKTLFDKIRQAVNILREQQGGDGDANIEQIPVSTLISNVINDMQTTKRGRQSLESMVDRLDPTQQARLKEILEKQATNNAMIDELTTPTTNDDGEPLPPLFASLGLSTLKKLKKLLLLDAEPVVPPIRRLEPNPLVDNNTGDYLTVQFSDTKTGQVLYISKGGYDKLMTPSLLSPHEYIAQLQLEARLKSIHVPLGDGRSEERINEAYQQKEMDLVAEQQRNKVNVSKREDSAVQQRLCVKDFIEHIQQHCGCCNVETLKQLKNKTLESVVAIVLTAMKDPSTGVKDVSENQSLGALKANKGTMVTFLVSAMKPENGGLIYLGKMLAEADTFDDMLMDGDAMDVPGGSRDAMLTVYESENENNQSVATNVEVSRLFLPQRPQRPKPSHSRPLVTHLQHVFDEQAEVQQSLGMVQSSSGMSHFLLIISAI